MGFLPVDQGRARAAEISHRLRDSGAGTYAGRPGRGQGWTPKAASPPSGCLKALRGGRGAGPELSAPRKDAAPTWAGQLRRWENIAS